jgi:hypothetical protein
MTQVGSRMEPDEHRAAEARPRYHRLGVILTGIGILLIGVNIVIVFGGAIALTAWSAAAQSGHPDGAANTVSSMMSVGVLTLLGEQLRRGGIGRSSRAQTTMLPQGSYVSSFSPLRVGWHTLWALVTLAAALVLILVPTLATITGGWPTTLGGDYAFATSWQTDGIVVLAIAVASLVSLFKKVTYLARLRSQRAVPSTVSASWRWLTFRWRFDLWVAAFGGLLVGLSSIAITSTSWDVADPNLVSNLLGGLVVLLPGLGFIALGMWMSSNYWKAGEPMGAAESYS